MLPEKPLTNSGRNRRRICAGCRASRPDNRWKERRRRCRSGRRWQSNRGEPSASMKHSDLRVIPPSARIPGRVGRIGAVGRTVAIVREGAHSLCRIRYAQGAYSARRIRRRQHPGTQEINIDVTMDKVAPGSTAAVVRMRRADNG